MAGFIKRLFDANPVKKPVAEESRPAQNSIQKHIQEVLGRNKITDTLKGAVDRNKKGY